MKHKSLLMLGVSAMMLTSCDQEIINNFGDNGFPQLTVTGTVAGQDSVKSRAFNTSWEAGDEIGLISSGYINKKYVTTDGDGIFTTECENYFFKDVNSATFRAYYPYTTSVVGGESISFQVLSTANEEGQKPNDYLWAEGYASYKKPSLSLSFKHVMTKVIINLRASTADGFKADDIFATNGNYKTSDASLSNVYKNVYFNLVDGETQGVYGYYQIDMTDPVDDTENNVRTYTMILAPQSNVSFSQVFNKDLSTEQIYKVTLNKTDWEPGTIYTYNLVLKKERLVVDSQYTISDWDTADAVDSELHISAY